MSPDPQMAELIHSLDGIVWEADPATAQTLFVSRQAEQILGYPMSQWLEEPTFWVDHLHPEDRDGIVAFRAEATRNQRGDSVEYRMIAQGGRTVWLQDLVSVVVRDGRVERLRGVMVDITRRQAAAPREATIDQVRDSYRSLMMEMPFLVWKGTPDGGCEYINRAWLDFTGSDLDHLRGNQWAEWVHPEDQPVLMQTYAAAMASLQPMAMEFRMRHQGGGYRWVQGQGKPIYGLDGRFDGFLAACNDIHDSRMAEAALAVSEQRFRTVADFTYDWEYWLSKEGGIQWMSPSCERVTGYPPEAFAADLNLLTRILHPDDQSRFEDHVHESRSGGDHLPMDFRILHKDGRQIWISHICVPVFDLEGRPMGRRVSNRDITDRRRAEEALLEASQQRRSMLEAASVARVVPWSMGPNRHMHWGDSANLVLGQSPTAMGSQPGWPLTLIQEEDRARLQQALREAELGFVASFECRMRHGLGHSIWTRWTLAQDQDSFHGAVQDITEQHAIQEQLLQSQKLESVGTLVGGIAHDFNNLLGAILGYCEIFEADEGLNAKQRKGLGVIQGAAQRGRELVNQLMGFSRKMAPNRVRTNLNVLVAEAGNLVARALPGDIRLVLEPCPDLPDALLDSGQIHQVVMNLVINSRDAIQAPGHITLRTGRSDIGPETTLAHNLPPGPYLFLEVEDTGCGIPPDRLHRIFEPFYTTKGLKGTGLGLSVVYGLVTEHGGFMECQSEVGHGTRFRVMLPLNLPPADKRGDSV